jgi:NitT/TauT family transport system permease protein
MMTDANNRVSILFWQILILAIMLSVWQWGYDLKPIFGTWVPRILDPYFISTPSEIWVRFLHLSCAVGSDGNFIAFSGAMGKCLAANDNNLWIATAVTLKNTFWGFLIGTSTGAIAGLALGRSDLLARIFHPYIVAFNSIPRIALVPLIILIFGLGDLSKIMTAWVVVFFLVFFNTFEGARAVDRDLLAASRLLGATQYQRLVTVVIPSTMAWVFASLSNALSFSLIGVIVGEFIGAERGLGRFIQEAQARAISSDMMVAILVLMIVGVILTLGINLAQSYLLRWQPHLQDQR